jgi:hypothetical protein
MSIPAVAKSNHGKILEGLAEKIKELIDDPSNELPPDTEIVIRKYPRSLPSDKTYPLIMLTYAGDELQDLNFEDSILVSYSCLIIILTAQDADKAGGPTVDVLPYIRQQVRFACYGNIPQIPFVDWDYIPNPTFDPSQLANNCDYSALGFVYKVTESRRGTI